MCATNGWRALATALLVTAMLVPLESHARWRADWELTYQLLFSDNVGRDFENEQDDLIHVPQVALFLTEDTGRFTGTVDLLAERRFYQDDTFDDEDRNYLDVDLRWRILDNRLEWVFEDELREEPINVRVNDRPDNFQQVNVFTTGPNLVFQLGRGNNGILQARFSDTYAEEQKQFDSQRNQLGVGVQRILSDVTTVSITGSATDVDFDRDDLSTDYIRRSLYGTWNHARRRDVFNVNLGWAEVDLRGGPEFDVDDVLLEATWTRTDNRYTIGVDLFHGINSLARSIGSTPLVSGGSVVTGNVTEEDSIAFRYDYRPNIGLWQVRAGYSEDDFVGDDLFDRKRYNLGVTYQRPFTRRSNGEFYASRYEVEYTAVEPRNDDRSEIGFRYNYEWSAHWYGGLQLQWTDQNSDIQQFDYEELLAGIRITYRRNPPGAGTAR